MRKLSDLEYDLLVPHFFDLALSGKLFLASVRSSHPMKKLIGLKIDIFTASKFSIPTRNTDIGETVDHVR